MYTYENKEVIIKIFLATKGEETGEVIFKISAK
jgi:hypothetical protein